MKIGLFSTSFRRRALDRDLSCEAADLHGLAIDLGGERQRRGSFQIPVRSDLRWFNVNIDPDVRPDIIASVEHVPLGGAIADTVICTEVLEHVLWPEKVVRESHRLLRPGGRFLGSMPFLHRVHGDPVDFQRYTADKLAKLFYSAGYTQVETWEQGHYFTVLADMLRDGLNQLRSRLFRWPLGLLLYPLFRFLIYIDSRSWVTRSSRLCSYTTGYFIRAVKP